MFIQFCNLIFLKWKKKNCKSFFFIFSIILFFYLIYNFQFKKPEKSEKITEIQEQIETNSNIIEKVNYTSKDADGNEYIINASKGEIDYSKPEIIFLTEVKALINLNNSEKITITSDYGKYNSNNFDTIFSKNVIINYLDNKITGEYLDFSLENNLMMISRNVILKNNESSLKADVVELELDTKDMKIFMYEENKKINIKAPN